MKTISCKEVSMEECDFEISDTNLDDARDAMMAHVKNLHGDMKEDERAAMMTRMVTSWNQKPSL